MLKAVNSLKNTETLETRAGQALLALLAQVPVIEVQSVEYGHASEVPPHEVDMLAHVIVSGSRMTLVCEVKSNGQPRYVRMGLLQLRNNLAHYGPDATPILIAPYLSQEAQALCRDQSVGFLDFEGNAHLAFDGVFIERLVATRPAVERRELKSLFKPKSAQVLRTMLRDPSRAWRVTELAEVAGVSLGHVSNVRVGLLEREWAQVSSNGMLLSAPDTLLDAWCDAYESPGKRMPFYTTLHGSAFEDAAREAMGANTIGGRVAFASFSAAHWLAPYGRTGTQYFYADEKGIERLRATLKLSPSTKGDNVVIIEPKDEGVFHDTVEPAPGAICTSPVQTYLDLMAAGERGEEAAQHLRHEKLTWKK